MYLSSCIVILNDTMTHEVYMDIMRTNCDTNVAEVELFLSSHKLWDACLHNLVV